MKELKGLIYCRVSSTKQITEGNGLSSQEQTCRNYASNILGIEIEKVFHEEGVSGGIFERKSIRALFDYIDKNKLSNFVVIFDDLNRLSRDIQVHGLLKAEFKKRGVELACPNFQFEETPEGDFKENISVVVSEYERKKNRQRVIDRQQARLEQGFWCFPVPIGYKYIKDIGGGKIIVKDENAKIIKKILEDYAHSKIGNINEIIRILHSKGIKVGTMVGTKVYNSNLAHRILSNILYTGYLEFPEKNISLRKAKHEAIISMEIYKLIQNRLEEKVGYMRTRLEENLNRKDLSEDFPLRGFLYCEESGFMLSGGWSKGKHTKYPYYCFTRYSPNGGKSINRDSFHIEFEKLLSKIQLKPEFINVFLEIYKRISSLHSNEKIELEKKEEEKIETISKKILKFIERIGNTESEILVINYENEIKKLEQEKADISKNLSLLRYTKENVGTQIETKINLYKDSLYIWKNSTFETRKKLLTEVFPQGIPINKKKQVGTPTFSLIYGIIKDSKGDKDKMVELVGFEPTS